MAKFIRFDTVPEDEVCTELWIASDKIETVARVGGKTVIFTVGRQYRYEVKGSVQEVIELING